MSRVVINMDRVLPCTECRQRSRHKMDCSLRPTITGRDVAEEALRLAVSRPGYEYPLALRCVYVPDPTHGLDAPPCLFGRALLNLGIDKVRLRDIQRQAMPEQVDSIAYMLRHLGITADETVDEKCNEAQSRQDISDPWGSNAIVEPLLSVFTEVQS